MDVLLTTGFLGTNTGSEMVVRDLSQALAKRGHHVTIYSPRAQDREAVGLPVRVVSRLDDLASAPDIIHGQHATSLVPAWRRFPSTPMIQSIHDVDHPLDEPLPLPSILHYVAVDEARARRIRAAGVPEERITLVPNAVTLERFRAKPPHQGIRRALVVAKYHEGFGHLARQILSPCGIEVEVVGIGSGGLRADFPDLLQSHDLLIGSGRCVLEAAAVGLSAVVCDERGFAGPLTLASWAPYRHGNFGWSVFDGPTTGPRLAEALDALDPSEAPRIRDIARREASVDLVADRLADLYRRVIAEPPPIPPIGFGEPLLDYVLRLQGNCLDRMMPREVAEGQHAIARLTVQEAAEALARQSIEAAAGEIRELRLQAEHHERQAADLRRFVDEVRASRSWQVTRPMRQAMTGMRRLRDGLRRVAPTDP